MFCFTFSILPVLKLPWVCYFCLVLCIWRHSAIVWHGLWRHDSSCMLCYCALRVIIFKDQFYFYLKGRVAERRWDTQREVSPVTGSLTRYCSGQSWADPKLGTSSSFRVFRVGAGTQVFRNFSAASQVIKQAWWLKGGAKGSQTGANSGCWHQRLSLSLVCYDDSPHYGLLHNTSPSLNWNKQTCSEVSLKGFSWEKSVFSPVSNRYRILQNCAKFYHFSLCMLYVWTKIFGFERNWPRKKEEDHVSFLWLFS